MCIVKFGSRRETFFIFLKEENNSLKTGLDQKQTDCIPGGLRTYTGGSFNNVGLNGYWWSSTHYGNGGIHRELYFSYSTVKSYSQSNGSNGLSVRCLRNLTGNTPIKFCD